LYLNACLLIETRYLHISLRQLKLNTLTFVSTCSLVSNTMTNIIQTHWHILSTDPKLRSVLQYTPCFPFKRQNTFIPSSHVLTQIPQGNFNCHNCACCNAMIKSDPITHPKTNKQFKVRGRITCVTKFVVYLLKCPCGLCYVGKTIRELKTRRSEHKSAIRNNEIRSAVERHFNEQQHSVCTFRFMRIEVVHTPRRGGDPNKLLLHAST
ncbi:hypothetical protein HHUSO_G21543, partial [Huso huso]